MSPFVRLGAFHFFLCGFVLEARSGPGREEDLLNFHQDTRAFCSASDQLSSWAAAAATAPRASASPAPFRPRTAQKGGSVWPCPCRELTLCFGASSRTSRGRRGDRTQTTAHHLPTSCSAAVPAATAPSPSLAPAPRRQSPLAGCSAFGSRGRGTLHSRSGEITASPPRCQRGMALPKGSLCSRRRTAPQLLAQALPLPENARNAPAQGQGFRNKAPAKPSSVYRSAPLCPIRPSKTRPAKADPGNARAAAPGHAPAGS